MCDRGNPCARRQGVRPQGRAGREAVGAFEGSERGRWGSLRSSTVRLVATSTPEAVATALNCSSEASTFAIFSATSRCAGSCGRRVRNGLTRQRWKAIVKLDGLVTCGVRSWEFVRPPPEERARRARGQGMGRTRKRQGKDNDAEGQSDLSDSVRRWSGWR